MIFKQLFEPLSSTYTYLIASETTGEAMLIDPVIATVERDLALLDGLGLKLAYTVDTHIHADHITSALTLKKRVGSRIANPAIDHLPCTDLYLEEGKPLQLGELALHPLHTPGHTDGHFAYKLGARVFTGDALLIDGCGRTDFQNGNAADLYRSIHDKLYTLPDETLVFVTPEEKKIIRKDQADCMGCLSQCQFSSWADNEKNSTGRLADPRSFCIQKTLQDIAHGEPIEDNLMFAGHAAYRFKQDPFYSNNFTPTVKQLVDRILTGD